MQRLDYLRVVHPLETLVTGTTRDGTRAFHHGRLAARVPQFRFTVRMSDILAGIETVGMRRERGDVIFMESLTAPAVLVTAFPVDSVKG